jgi:hypothetical protein
LTGDQARAAIGSATGVELREAPNDGQLFAWHDGMVAFWVGQGPGQNVALVVAADTNAADRADQWFDDMATWTYLHHGTVVVIYSHEDGTPDLTGQLEAALNSA